MTLYMDTEPKLATLTVFNPASYRYDDVPPPSSRRLEGARLNRLLEIEHPTSTITKSYDFESHGGRNRRKHYYEDEPSVSLSSKFEKATIHHINRAPRYRIVWKPRRPLEESDPVYSQPPTYSTTRRKKTPCSHLHGDSTEPLLARRRRGPVLKKGGDKTGRGFDLANSRRNRSSYHTKYRYRQYNHWRVWTNPMTFEEHVPDRLRKTTAYTKTPVRQDCCYYPCGSVTRVKVHSIGSKSLPHPPMIDSDEEGVASSSGESENTPTTSKSPRSARRSKSPAGLKSRLISKRPDSDRKFFEPLPSAGSSLTSPRPRSNPSGKSGWNEDSPRRSSPGLPAQSRRDTIPIGSITPRNRPDSPIIGKGSSVKSRSPSRHSRDDNNNSGRFLKVSEQEEPRSDSSEKLGTPRKWSPTKMPRLPQSATALKPLVGNSQSSTPKSQPRNDKGDDLDDTDRYSDEDGNERNNDGTASPDRLGSATSQGSRNKSPQHSVRGGTRANDDGKENGDRRSIGGNSEGRRMESPFDQKKSPRHSIDSLRKDSLIADNQQGLKAGNLSGSRSPPLSIKSGPNTKKPYLENRRHSGAAGSEGRSSTDPVKSIRNDLNAGNHDELTDEVRSTQHSIPSRRNSSIASNQKPRNDDRDHIHDRLISPRHDIKSTPQSIRNSSITSNQDQHTDDNLGTFGKEDRSTPHSNHDQNKDDDLETSRNELKSPPHSIRSTRNDSIASNHDLHNSDYLGKAINKVKSLPNSIRSMIRNSSMTNDRDQVKDGNQGDTSVGEGTPRSETESPPHPSTRNGSITSNRPQAQSEQLEAASAEVKSPPYSMRLTRKDSITSDQNHEDVNRNGSPIDQLKSPQHSIGSTRQDSVNIDRMHEEVDHLGSLRNEMKTRNDSTTGDSNQHDGDVNESLRNEMKSPPHSVRSARNDSITSDWNHSNVDRILSPINEVKSPLHSIRSTRHDSITSDRYHQNGDHIGSTRNEVNSPQPPIRSTRNDSIISDRNHQNGDRTGSPRNEVKSPQHSFRSTRNDSVISDRNHQNGDHTESLRNEMKSPPHSIRSTRNDSVTIDRNHQNVDRIESPRSEVKSPPHSILSTRHDSITNDRNHQNGDHTGEATIEAKPPPHSLRAQSITSNHSLDHIGTPSNHVHFSKSHQPSITISAHNDDSDIGDKGVEERRGSNSEHYEKNDIHPRRLSKEGILDAPMNNIKEEGNSEIKNIDGNLNRLVISPAHSTDLYD